MGEEAPPARQRVIIAHGWLARPHQVRALGKAIAVAGFDVRYVAYDSWFGRFERAVETALRAAREDIGIPVHLIGFSLGGLVMRAAAAEPIPELTSLLLIGVPNAGSLFADILSRVFPTPALRRLSSSAPKLPEPPAGVQVGCIAGDQAGFTGLFLAKPNDGRVTVASALDIRYDHHVTVTCKHRTLHRDPETIRHAVAFVTTGRF